MKPQVTFIIGDRVHTGPLAPEQYNLINPGFWRALARIHARIMREEQAKEVRHGSEQTE